MSAAADLPETEDWPCGAFGPPTIGGMGYRCTLPAGHMDDLHEAWLDGELLSSWPRQGAS